MASQQEKEHELKRIYERDGEVRPSVVVKEAKSRKNPLHNEFEWDDQKAAHQHRLSTARRIIRVTVYRQDDSPAKQRFVHVRPQAIDGPTAATREREGVYKPAKVVASNPGEYERALQEMMRHLRAIERSITELRAAAGEDPQLMPTLQDAMKVAKDTVRLMLNSAA